MTKFEEGLIPQMLQKLPENDPKERIFFKEGEISVRKHGCNPILTLETLNRCNVFFHVLEENDFQRYCFLDHLAKYKILIINFLDTRNEI